MVLIIFEAHATSIDNENHVSSGHFDAKLSPLGLQQAEDLGKRYAPIQFDAILCSDLERSYKTAEIAFAGREIPIIQDARLRECNYGEMTQKSSDSVDVAKQEHITLPFPGGESYEMCAKRMYDFLSDCMKKYDNKKIMIVGHRATQYGLEHWIKGVGLLEAVTAPWAWQPGWVYVLKKL